MNRALKFRAWQKRARKMADVTMLDFTLDAYRATAGTTSGSGRLADIELMQFTGLVDKNGRDIYEGDIVATGLSDKHVKSVVRIGMTSTEGSDNCYAEEYYGVYLEGSAGLMDYLLRNEMYVIGNTYEHPHLIGGSHEVG